MFWARFGLVSVAAFVLAGPVLADDAAANRLLRQAHAAWLEAGALPEGDPARAEALARVQRDLAGLVAGYPDSTAATFLALGASIGPLSLQAVRDAVAEAGPAADVRCETDACLLQRIEALPAGLREAQRLRVRVLVRLDRMSEAMAFGSGKVPGDDLMSEVAIGAAGAGRRDEADRALARIADADARDRATARAAATLARAAISGVPGASTDAALQMVAPLGAKYRTVARWTIVSDLVTAGHFDAAEALAPEFAGLAGRIRDAIARRRVELAVAAPAPDFAAALVLAEAVAIPGSRDRGAALGLVAGALAVAGRLDEAEALLARPEANFGDVGLEAVAQALAGAGRLPEARAVIARIASDPGRRMATSRAEDAAALAAGPEAILATLAAAPASDDLIREVESLAHMAGEAGDWTMQRILLAEVLRLVAALGEQNTFETRMAVQSADRFL